MRLTTRLFLLISFLIALTVGTAVVVTLLLSARIGRQTITERLETGDALRWRQADERYDRFELLADLFVADANLIAYVAEAQDRADSASILDLLLERQEDLGFDFAVVTDPDGYVLARTDDLTAAGQDLVDQPLIAIALDEFRSAGLWPQRGPQGDELYYAVVIPLVQGGTELLGFFATAYRIDDFAAAESKRLDGSEVAYTLFGPAQSTLIGSSFDTVLGPAISPVVTSWTASDVAQLPADAPPVLEMEAAGETWLVHRALLTDAAGDPLGLRLTAASLRAETAGFRRVGTALLAVGLATVLVGFLLTYLLARHITRPLSRLVGAARQARSGQYETEIPTTRQDEVGQLGREFRALLSELREKRDMEAYVAELSRNLPDAAPVAQRTIQAATHQELTLIAIEYRRHASSGDGDAERELRSLEADLTGAAGEIVRSRGSVMSFAGHRVLGLFQGPEHPVRALKVAIDACARAEPGQEPIVALGYGQVAIGTIEWQSDGVEAVCGRPAQMIETLLREGTSGEILLPISMRDAMADHPSLRQVDFPERLGVMTSLRYCAVDGTAARTLQTLTSTDAAASPRPGPIFAPGQVLVGRFEILSVAGSGGMGVVYRARDRKLGDVVALKTLRADAWQDRGRIELLKQEIKLARKITHPNVLRVFDLGEYEDVPFISMEYVRGVTLRQLLDKTPRLPFSAAMRLARQICLGLRAVHQAGILHHDMKPENVLLEPTGNARLMDFGIAAPVALGSDSEEGGKTQGTPYYLAPEQVQGEAVDARADIFATGVLLYELFTGGKPFRESKKLREIIQIKLTEIATPANEAWPEIPPALAELLARCLEKSPADRLGSVPELLAGLERIARPD